MLKTAATENLFRVVLIHHPPQSEAQSRRLGLNGADRFRDAIERAGAELVLHGHFHESMVSAIQGPKVDVPVVGVAAASAAPEGGEPPARYNLFEIERTTDGFSCLMHEYGFQRIGDDIVKRLELRLH
jgi:3',5'-cyclic AMP phosphodiesterase CpdA